VVVLLLAAGGWWWKSGRSADSRAATFTAKRGPLDITVLEGGSLQALESQEIKCEVPIRITAERPISAPPRSPARGVNSVMTTTIGSHCDER
jgi:hypothetical protein